MYVSQSLPFGSGFETISIYTQETKRDRLKLLWITYFKIADSKYFHLMLLWTFESNYDSTSLKQIYTIENSWTQFNNVSMQSFWFGHHQLRVADLNVAHLWVKNPQSRICQTKFWHCLLRPPHHTHHVTFQQPVLRSFLYGIKEAKYILICNSLYLCGLCICIY